jgi:hypothetical protein
MASKTESDINSRSALPLEDQTVIFSNKSRPTTFVGGPSYVEKVHKEKEKPISGGSSFLGKDTRPNPCAKKPAPCKKYVPRKKSSVLEALPKVIKILFRRGKCRVGDQTLKVKG